MQEADLIRFRHMLDAANEIMEYTRNKTSEDFKNDRKLNLSVVRLLEIIGEAATDIPHDIKNECQNLPWKEIIGMRNRLIHGYFEIDLDIVWNTVIHDIPPLISELEKVIN